MKNILTVVLIICTALSTKAQNANSAIDGTLIIGGSSPESSRELKINDTDNDDDAIIEMTANSKLMILGLNASNGGIIGMTTKDQLTFRTNNNTRMLISENGRIGINDNTPDATLWVKDAIDGTKFVFGAEGSVASSGGLFVFPTGGVRVGIAAGSTGDPGSKNFAVQNSISTENGNITAGSWFGSGVTNPQAPFHGSFNGASNVPRIMAILESPVSKRPVLLFSEGGTALSNGMSIEYNGIPSGADNEMYINGSTGNPLFTFTNGGRLGVNETNPAANLFIKQVGTAIPGVTIENDTDGDTWSFEIGGNDMKVLFNGVQVGFFEDADGSYNATSDIRAKRDITPLNSVLDKILNLKPSEYYYKRNENQEQKSVGFIAQDLIKELPQLVNGEENSLYAVNYAGMSTFLVKAIQEQQVIIDAQKAEIDKLRQATEKNAALIKELSTKMK